MLKADESCEDVQAGSDASLASQQNPMAVPAQFYTAAAVILAPITADVDVGLVGAVYRAASAGLAAASAGLAAAVSAGRGAGAGAAARRSARKLRNASTSVESTLKTYSTGGALGRVSR